MRLERLAQTDDPDEYVVRGDGTRLVTCDHEEVRSFNMVRGVGLGLSVPCVVALDAGGSRPCDTALDYHFVCANSNDCVGYTTKLVGRNAFSSTYREEGDYDEVPFMLHTRSYAYTPEAKLSSLDAFGESGSASSA